MIRGSPLDKLWVRPVTQRQAFHVQFVLQKEWWKLKRFSIYICKLQIWSSKLPNWILVYNKQTKIFIHPESSQHVVHNLIISDWNFQTNICNRIIRKIIIVSRERGTKHSIVFHEIFISFFIWITYSIDFNDVMTIWKIQTKLVALYLHAPLKLQT